jgi:hypothetical protein
MKNFLLGIVLILFCQFSFGRNIDVIEFPTYETSMHIPELECLDCKADCTFSSCSGKGRCHCSCKWFKCDCEQNDEDQPAPELTSLERVSMNLEQYEKTKLLALLLKSMGEESSYELLTQMVLNLKAKEYKEYHLNRDILLKNFEKYNENNKEILNSFFNAINAKERV